MYVVGQVAGKHILILHVFNSFVALAHRRKYFNGENFMIYGTMSLCIIGSHITMETGLIA